VGVVGHNVCKAYCSFETTSTTSQTALPLEHRPTKSLTMAGKGDKIEKIIARLQARIADGGYYEAQQQTRVVAARYTKARNWDAAIDILYNVTQSLLKAGQGGSGGDLAVLLVDTYKQAELKPDSTTKGRLLTCLRLFDSEEPTRKKYIGEMIGYETQTHTNSLPIGQAWTSLVKLLLTV